jgi:Tol biopolymer transport system component
MTRVLAGLAVAFAATAPAAARATSLPVRTFLVSSTASGIAANGPSSRPALSASGRVVAFDTAAGDLFAGDGNGAVRDVVALDLTTNARRLVSIGLDGSPADGDSIAPTLDATGTRVVFTSAAGNLVPRDANHVTDVFARDGDGPIVRVSVATGGGEANGPSSEPDISADGRYVAFTSSASNLVPGDTNRRPDVFLRDLVTGTTTRVSVTTAGRQAAGASTTPAISADGRVVSFASTAPQLVPHDRNGLPDVFVRDLRAQRTERVSVGAGGREQSRAVIAPFTQVSDLSADGRYVVFDSDAPNLVGGDVNRHTDVFLRDRLRHTTELVSLSSTNAEGDNDSFAPTISADGRFVTFESFASNLAPGDGPREDVMLRDLAGRATTVVNVPADGSVRKPELVRQLLQRPAVSHDGRFALFTSTAPGMAGGDGNGVEDVFVRALDPPRGHLVRATSGPRPRVELAADDPAARRFVCRMDRGQLFACPGGRAFRLPRMRPGRHVLTARAGGPGMLFDPDPIRAVVTVTAR